MTGVEIRREILQRLQFTVLSYEQLVSGGIDPVGYRRQCPLCALPFPM